MLVQITQVGCVLHPALTGSCRDFPTRPTGQVMRLCVDEYYHACPDACPYLIWIEVGKRNQKSASENQKSATYEVSMSFGVFRADSVFHKLHAFDDSSF